ncbi:BMP family lipoprotein [Haloarcula halophila]|uniref:BMP family lipoprotein n=1 Tax=Haloarcula TaxID=2237 RepID=UPI0023E418AE|nr:BMP family ABC transporter substrate-binding protein [Halomicroarcula sp. DFY41]
MTRGENSGNDGERSPKTAQSGIDRRNVLKSGAGLFGVAGLAGCLSEPGSNDGGSSGDGESSDGSSGDGESSDGGSNGGGGSETTNIAIISSPAGFGDKAFNDLAIEGLQTAAEEFDIEVQQVEETEQSRYQTVQSRLAESQNPDYDLIVLVGFNHTQALETNASEYPDQRWMLINDVIDQPNVAGFIWANHEMSFQAGVLAGTMTTRELTHEGNSNDPDGKVVGFTGGVDGPLIRAFEQSYIKGVEWVDSEIDVKVGYAGSFSSPQDGKEVALSQYDSGADIVYHAAAATGQGVFQAAQDEERFAIGVDADQSQTLPEYQDVIIGSAVKYINEGTAEAAQAVVEDNWSSVQGENILGLEQDAVEVVLGQAIGPKLPDVVSENLESAREAVINGDVTVPCSASGCQN